MNSNRSDSSEEGAGEDRNAKGGEVMRCQTGAGSSSSSQHDATARRALPSKQGDPQVKMSLPRKPRPPPIASPRSRTKSLYASLPRDPEPSARGSPGIAPRRGMNSTHASSPLTTLRSATTLSLKENRLSLSKSPGLNRAPIPRKPRPPPVLARKNIPPPKKHPRKARTGSSVSSESKPDEIGNGVISHSPAQQMCTKERKYDSKPVVSSVTTLLAKSESPVMSRVATLPVNGSELTNNMQSTQLPRVPRQLPWQTETASMANTCSRNPSSTTSPIPSQRRAMKTHTSPGSSSPSQIPTRHVSPATSPRVHRGERSGGKMRVNQPHERGVCGKEEENLLRGNVAVVESSGAGRSRLKPPVSKTTPQLSNVSPSPKHRSRHVPSTGTITLNSKDHSSPATNGMEPSQEKMSPKSRSHVRRLTIHFEERQQPKLSPRLGGPPKRSTLPMQTKPSPPLQRRVYKPPVPLPRSPYSSSSVNKKSDAIADEEEEEGSARPRQQQAGWKPTAKPRKHLARSSPNLSSGRKPVSPRRVGVLDSSFRAASEPHTTEPGKKGLTVPPNKPPTQRRSSSTLNLQKTHSGSGRESTPEKQVPIKKRRREGEDAKSVPQEFRYSSGSSTVAQSSAGEGVVANNPSNVDALYIHMSSPSESGSSSPVSERRGSTFSTSQPLLERARQLSLNKKWCDQPEVIKSESLSNLSKSETHLQEAIFEVVVSEATYHLNLATLVDSFMDDPKLDPNKPEGEKVMNRKQHSIIFSNVKEIRKVSASLLEELLCLTSEDVLLRNMFPILGDYAENRFLCYERYCASQSHRLKELRECVENSESFQKHLKTLEEAAYQTLLSLLTAPMQRITKLPLLMNEILKRTPPDDPSRASMEFCLKATEKMAGICNEGAGKIGDLVHLENIWKKLNFGQLKPFHIMSPGRRLRKEGPIDRLKVNKRRSRLQPDKIQLYLFVFTDLLMITSEDREKHSVVDYCPLTKLTVEDITASAVHNLESSTSSEESALSGAEWTVAMAGEEHGFLVTLHESVSKQAESYIFIAKSSNEKTQWMGLLTKPTTDEVVMATPKLLDGRNLTRLKTRRKKKAPPRKLWWKQPHVARSGIVPKLSQRELELQEAMFEVLTSEEVYLSDLDTLVTHYMDNSGLNPDLPEEQRVLNRQEYHHIFSNIKEITDISRGMVQELHLRHVEEVLVDSISDILLLCVERKFHHYIHYCTNLPNQLEQLQSSIETNESFSGYLRQLEEDQPTLQSLLEAPINRVKRLPYLVKAILEKTEPGLNHSLVESALRAVEKVEKLSVAGQQKVMSVKELHSIEKQLDFGNHRPLTLLSVSRSLVRRGTLARLKIVTPWFSITKTVRRKQNYVIVLTDYILVTKRAENIYQVIDHSPLNKIQVEQIEPLTDPNSSFPGGDDIHASARWAVSKAGVDHAFLLTFLEMRRSYIFIADNDDDRRKWIESLTVPKVQLEEESMILRWDYLHVEAVADYQPKESNRDKLKLKTGDVVRVYRVTDEWCEGLKVLDLHWGKVPVRCVAETTRSVGEGSVQECLVEATHDFQASEEGELSLETGDVVKVYRKMAGWFEGKKRHSHAWGWFPGNCTKELDTDKTSNTS